MVNLLEKDLVYRIVGCAMRVHKKVGPGLREKTYERGLCEEFKYLNIAFTQQQEFPVYYRHKVIDRYIPDLIVEDRVIVENKAVEAITDEHRAQILNYLKITGIKVGLIINYKHTKLEWERLVLDTAR
jgi:GxxExxY protein